MRVAGVPVWQWAIWALVVFGIPLVGIEALDAYPMLGDGNAWIWIPPLVVGVAAFLASAINRRRLFPWGRDHPVIQWGTILGIAALAGMAMLAATVFVNGRFDPSGPVVERFEVQSVHGYRDRVTIRLADETGRRTSVSLPRSDARGVRPGHSAYVTVRSGRMAPWVEQVEFGESGRR